MVNNNDDDPWKGIEEGDIVEVVGGIGDIESLPRAKVVSLGHAGDNGFPTVIVRYIGCISGNSDDCIFCQKYDDGLCRTQEWYPNQVRKVDNDDS